MKQKGTSNFRSPGFFALHIKSINTFNLHKIDHQLVFIITPVSAGISFFLIRNFN